MAEFGGTIKLTGADEYKKALNDINRNLKEVGAEMKLVSSSFDKSRLERCMGASQLSEMQPRWRRRRRH